MQDNRTMTFRCLWSRLGNRAIAIALLLTVLLGASASAAVLPAVMKTPYFTVHYNPADRQLAESTADTARMELARISNALGYTIERGRPIPLMVYSSHVAFIKAGNIEDRMTVGTARSGDETVSIDASETLVSIRLVLAHEITHAVIFRILGTNSYALPLWANEGLAKYESQGFTGDDEDIIAESTSDGTIMPLSSLRTSFPAERSALAYAESWSAISYLVKKHGESAPKAMLAELARTGSFDSAISKVTGGSQNQFIKGWNDSLKERFGMARVLQIALAFIWPIMALLAVVAFIVRRKRMRDAARQWDMEQFEESMERQLREWPHR